MRFVRLTVLIAALSAIAACSNYDKTTSTATVQTSSFAIATETTASAPPSTMSTPAIAPMIASTPSSGTPSVVRIDSQPTTSTAAQAGPTDTFPKRISLGEAQTMVDAGKAVIVDVRSREDYAAEHIKGAISFPLGEVVARMAELPKGKTIITYCT